MAKPNYQYEKRARELAKKQKKEDLDALQTVQLIFRDLKKQSNQQQKVLSE